MKQILIEHGVPCDKVWILPHGEFSIYKKWEQSNIKEIKNVLFFGRISKYIIPDYLILGEL